MRISDNIYLSNEDNMSLMARYPDNHFDLAIVDLEFGIGASKPSDKSGFVSQKNGQKKFVRQQKHKHKDWDLKLSPPEYFTELFRVSKHQIIKGGNYYGLDGGYLVWDKLNGESDQMGAEMMWLSFSNRTDIVYYMWAGMMQGIYCGKNIREALVQQGNKKLNETKIHPTQTPVPVYKYLLLNYAKKGFKILDTHHGSGSLSLACYDYGFDLTACEIDKEYYADSVQRIKNHIAFNQSLFTADELRPETSLFNLP